MKLDVLGLIGACSYALDCVEAELVHVTNKHAKRVAYMSVCTAMQMGITDRKLQDLAVCALLHDNALTQYIQEEFHNDISHVDSIKELPHAGAHCVMGEQNIKDIPFYTDVKNVILYHHENADGSGPFGKKWNEIPLFARIIHMCDLLDMVCLRKAVDFETWKKISEFLSKIRGTVIDDECADAFMDAGVSVMNMEDSQIEKSLWEKVPREKIELTFEQIKNIAGFFARIVDYKSPFTSTHSIGVAECARKLSGYMGFDDETVQKMYLAGALHDIGKVAIGNDILEKPDRLTDEEYALMKSHVEKGAQILKNFTLINHVEEGALYHHERYDGSGYMYGLKGEEIPLNARIIGIADAFDAMTANRVYRKKLDKDYVIREIKRGSGTQFDPKLVEIMLGLIEKGLIDMDNLYKDGENHGEQ
mgnify:CR=1 FL=1